jgi:hypothetical protein
MKAWIFDLLVNRIRISLKYQAILKAAGAFNFSSRIDTI